MNKDFPLVSIISICYNHSQFVRENLDAIAQQDYKNIELIIIDDFSTDNSTTVIKNWIAENQADCKFVAHEQNMGVCATMNEAIGLASGKYICLIASDDVMCSDKTTKQLMYLEESTDNIALVCSNFSEIDADSKIIKEAYFEDSFKFSDKLFETILTQKGVYIHSPTVMIKREVYDRVGLYNPDYIQEDLYMWLKVAQEYEIGFIPDVTVKYRVLDSSLSNNALYREKMLMDRIKVLQSFEQDAKPSGKEFLYFGILSNSINLCSYYLEKGEYVKIKEQIKLQSKYFMLNTNLKILPLLNSEITGIYLSNKDLYKEVKEKELFSHLPTLKKLMFDYFPYPLVQKLINLKNA